jgi:hypothetical protein
MALRFSRCKIFDERQFQHRAVVGLAGDDGHFRQFSSCAARQRRSPAINSKKPPRSRTMSGCTMPCSRMESASSLNASAEKSLRGCSGHGRMRSSGTRCTRSRVSGARGGHGVETGGCRRGRRLGQNRIAAQQRAETASQSRFCHARRVSQGRGVVNAGDM